MELWSRCGFLSDTEAHHEYLGSLPASTTPPSRPPLPRLDRPFVTRVDDSGHEPAPRGDLAAAHACCARQRPVVRQLAPWPGRGPDLALPDLGSNRLRMFAFARDTENINFCSGSLMKRLMPVGWNCGDECLLDGPHQWETNNRVKFPSSVKERSVEATREAVEALSGSDIQYSVRIDLHGFQQLVKAVGGLTVDVMQRTPIGGGTSRVSGYIAPGVPNLDGYRALWYASSRQGSSNQERMARQRCVMTSMLQQLNAHTVLLKLQDLVRPGGSIVRTEIPQEQLGMLVDLALKAKAQKVRSVSFLPALINPWSYDPAMVRSTAPHGAGTAESDLASVCSTA